MLKLAKTMGILKVGMVSVDGTKIKAKAADEAQEGKDDTLKGELARHAVLREKVRKAKEELERRAQERAEQEQKTAKKRSKKEKNSDKGPNPPSPSPVPEETWQSNMTDRDSRIMKKNAQSEYSQAYNPQAAVDAEGTMLVLGGYVTNNGTDRKELAQSSSHGIPTVSSPGVGQGEPGVDSGHVCLQFEKTGKPESLKGVQGLYPAF